VHCSGISRSGIIDTEVCKSGQGDVLHLLRGKDDPGNPDFRAPPIFLASPFPPFHVFVSQRRQFNVNRSTCMNDFINSDSACSSTV
jgi:hypothetical protein